MVSQPTITGASPSSVMVGNSATVRVTGTDILKELEYNWVWKNEDTGVTGNIAGVYYQPCFLTECGHWADLPLPVSITNYIGRYTIQFNPYNWYPAKFTFTVYGNPPLINSVSPNPVDYGKAFTATIYGNYFDAFSDVYVKVGSGSETKITPSSYSQTQITVNVPASLAVDSSSISFRVVNRLLAGMGYSSSSGYASISVKAVPTPSISSISISGGKSSGTNSFVEPAYAGYPTITLNGSNFMQDCIVQVDSGSTARSVGGYGTQINFAYPSSAGAVGPHTIQVINPGNVSTRSNTITITITKYTLPAPTLTSVCQAGITDTCPANPDCGAFTLHLNGSNFESHCYILTNGSSYGSSIPFTIDSSTRITVNVPASIVTPGATFSFQVVNSAGAAGNDRSGTISITVKTPTKPVLNNDLWINGVQSTAIVNPSLTGYPSMAVHGSNFDNSCVVLVDEGAVAGTNLYGYGVFPDTINFAYPSWASTVGTHKIKVRKTACGTTLNSDNVITVTVTEAPPEPAPTITSVSPSTIPHNADTTVTITGTNLTSHCGAKLIDGTVLQTSRLGDLTTILYVTIPASKIPSGATSLSLIVFNSTTLAQATTSVAIAPLVQTPIISSLDTNPPWGGTEWTAGENLTLRINGSNLSPDYSQILVNGSTTGIPAEFQPLLNGWMQSKLPSWIYNTAGSYTITVRNLDVNNPNNSPVSNSKTLVISSPPTPPPPPPDGTSGTTTSGGPIVTQWSLVASLDKSTPCVPITGGTVFVNVTFARSTAGPISLTVDGVTATTTSNTPATFTVEASKPATTQLKIPFPAGAAGTSAKATLSAKLG